jgi:hypothetical protein
MTILSYLYFFKVLGSLLYTRQIWSLRINFRVLYTKVYHFCYFRVLYTILLGQKNVQ